MNFYKLFMMLFAIIAMATNGVESRLLESSNSRTKGHSQTVNSIPLEGSKTVDSSPYASSQSGWVT